MADPASIAVACLRLFVDELVRCGVAAVCMSPGSRSTPLVLAVSRDGRLPLHVHLDERSAAYAAVGIIRATGRPAAVVCTSGTAVANWHPAVVEAAQSQLPLLLLSADRPAFLRGTGANQTIDQLAIFGGAVRWFVDAAVPEERDDAARYWRSLGCSAVAHATGAVPGPVHVNLPLREPLVPDGDGDSVVLGAEATGRADGRPWSAASAPRVEPDQESVARVRQLLHDSARGVVVAGGLTRGAPAVQRLADALDWPLLAEPISGLRTGPRTLGNGVLVLGDQSFLDVHRPDLVLQVGAAPTARSVQHLVDAAGTHVVITEPGHASDPGRTATETLEGDVDAIASTIAPGSMGSTGGRAGWARAWAAADRVAGDAVADTIRRFGDELFEGAIARDVAAAVPAGSVLVAGSSMPIRDLDAYMRPRQGLDIVANRGASGIDGVLSTAVGCATVRPTTVLLGDLSLLHDAGALLWNGRAPLPLTVVVVNNGGGGIFGTLSAASLPELDRLFVTPHRVELQALAAAAGARYVACHTVAGLRAALGSGAESGPPSGVRVIEAVVDRLRTAKQQAVVRAAVSKALARD